MHMVAANSPERLVARAASGPLAARGIAARAFAVTMISGLFAGQACAQLAPGYSGQPGWRQADESEYWWSVSTLGNCLYSSKRTLSLALLSSERGSPGEQAAIKALVGKHTKCLQHLSRMGLGTVELRGTVAQAAYRASAKAPPAAVDHPVARAITRQEAGRLGADRLMAQMASCVVARYPGQVHQLLFSEMGSKVEAAVVDELGQPIGTCSPGRLRFQLSRSELRGLLAEAAFRRLSTGPTQ